MAYLNHTTVLKTPESCRETPYLNTTYTCMYHKILFMKATKCPQHRWTLPTLVADFKPLHPWHAVPPEPYLNPNPLFIIQKSNLKSSYIFKDQNVQNYLSIFICLFNLFLQTSKLQNIEIKTSYAFARMTLATRRLTSERSNPRKRVNVISTFNK